MFPAATAVTVARNVACRGDFSHFLSSCSCSVKSDGSTFHPGLSGSIVTSHVLLRCDQVLLRLSISFKVFSDKTWAMNDV